MGPLVLSLAFVGAIAWLVLLGAHGRQRDERSIDRARDQARRLGMELVAHERSVPHFSLFSSTRTAPRLRREWQVAYSLEVAPRVDARWSFVQRSHDPKGEFSNGYRLQVHHGEVSPEVRQVLLDIAMEWDHEYFEVEFFPESACAFWNEWVRGDGIREIHHHLQRVVAAATSSVVRAA